jgi:hypothetical protein
MEPRFSGPEAPWNKPPVLNENGLRDMRAWKGTLPTEMRPDEKRLAFRSEVNWTLQNIHESVGEELFNMLFDMIVERPDPTWCWKPERKQWGALRSLDQTCPHELWNVFSSKLDMTRVAIASPYKDGDWPFLEWWQEEKDLQRPPVKEMSIIDSGGGHVRTACYR